LEALIEYLTLQRYNERTIAGIVGPSTSEMAELLAYNSEAGMPAVMVRKSVVYSRTTFHCLYSHYWVYALSPYGTDRKPYQFTQDQKFGYWQKKLGGVIAKL